MVSILTSGLMMPLASVASPVLSQLAHDQIGCEEL